MDLYVWTLLAAVLLSKPHPLKLSQIENWVDDPRGKDLIVRGDLTDGFSFDVVIIFQEDNPSFFEHNHC